ncbi:hypothetical protein SUDANB176_07570 (plasmid) [Streptomyces sp. enrichment culture]|uniref:hypothetical protein n=1 Tax=Streptomyces sp. enrichment culture TaxID=1795815 RepID=UPI003F559975
MPTRRDLDGRAVLPLERIEALDHVLGLRKQILEAGGLPYPQDWPLPPCLECGAAVHNWVRGKGGLPTSYWFFPCGHGVVADRVRPLV